ncbi:hypothetical protein HN51_024429 [Arachis hypogaea]
MITLPPTSLTISLFSIPNAAPSAMPEVPLASLSTLMCSPTMPSSMPMPNTPFPTFPASCSTIFPNQTLFPTTPLLVLTLSAATVRRH